MTIEREITHSEKGDHIISNKKNSDSVKTQKVSSGKGQKTWGHTKQQEVIAIEADVHERRKRIHEFDTKIILYDAFEDHGLIVHNAPHDERPEIEVWRRELSSQQTADRAILRRLKTFKSITEE